MLVSQAYQYFFDRTLANFEALVEGRDIRIGRPANEDTPRAAAELQAQLARLAEAMAAALASLRLSPAESARVRPAEDSDGFVHVNPGGDASMPTPLTLPDWPSTLSEFIGGLSKAAARDWRRGAGS